MNYKIIFLIAFSILIFSHAAFSSSAIVSYVADTGSNCPDNALNCPRIKFFNPTNEGSFSSEIMLATSGSPIQSIVTKISPISSKILMATLGDDGYIDVYTCRFNCTNETSWIVSNNIAQVWSTSPIVYSRPFDLDFESATGKAVLVYGVLNSSTSIDIGYRILQDSEMSFGSNEGYLDDTRRSFDINYTWLNLVRNPKNTSTEIILSGFSNTTYGLENITEANAWVWNSSLFTNQTNLSSNSISTGTEAIATRYSSDGSLAMSMASNGTTGNITYVTWNGTNWSAIRQFDLDPDDSSVAQWITLKMDPSSDDLQAVIVDSAAKLNTAYWNGNTWEITNAIDNIDTFTTRPADFEWNSTGSFGYLIWDNDGIGTLLNTRICTPECNTATTTISTYSGTGSWIRLARNPTLFETPRIIGLRLNSGFNLGAFSRNLTSFFNYGDSSITSNTFSSTYESYYISFQTNSEIRAHSSFIGSSVVLTGVTANFTGSCEGLNGTALNSNIILQNSTNNITFDTTPSTGIVYSNISSYSIGALSGNSTTFSFGINVTKIGNYTFRTICNSTNSEPKPWANSTSKNLNVNDQAYGYLDVVLYFPFVLQNTNVIQNDTFSIISNVTCRSLNPTAICESVNVTALYNSTQGPPNTQINTTSAEVPLTSSGNVTCGKMNYSNTCQANWSVNATGLIGTNWNLSIIASSNTTKVLQNSSQNASITITGCFIDFSLQWDSIPFGNLLPSTGNPAPGNQDNIYNISINPGSCRLDFYMKGTNITNSSTNYKIDVGNITWSNVSNSSFSLSNELEGSNVAVRKNSLQNTNVTVWFWLNLPPVPASFYNGSIFITGVRNGDATPP